MAALAGPLAVLLIALSGPHPAAAGDTGSSATAWNWQRLWTAANDPPPGQLAATILAVRALPEAEAARSIAVHVTPEGHWQFATRPGETYTAGTPAELARAAAAVAPEAKDGFAARTLVLSRDSLFAGDAALKNMPAAGRVQVAIAGEIVPVRRTPSGTLAVVLKPGVEVLATSKASFLEALSQLRHPLDAGRIRLLSATPGGPATLPAVPRFDAASKSPGVDEVDPDRLPEALASIPRQTAILTARVDATNLTVKPASGPERQIARVPLEAAAAASGVDLIILHADDPLQPGGRNWLWQKIEIRGLDHARKRATVGDFLQSLAAGRTGFVIDVTFEGDETSARRIRLTATPVEPTLTTTDGMTGWLKQAAGAVAGTVTGSVQPAAIHARLARSSERVVFPALPGLQTLAPLAYLSLALLGLLSYPVAKRWWRRIWPVEQASDYDDARGYTLARIMRASAFLALFLPLAAVPALLMRLVHAAIGATRPRAKAPSG